MLNSIFSDTSNSLEVSTILICSLCSIILGMIIALVHKFTSKTNKNFLCAITVLPVLVQTIIIMVNGNLGTSVAIVGAFSLIRFRSLPGTSKEIAIVFFAMAIGLATGMGHIGFACIMTVIVCLALILFSKISLFDDDKKEKILEVVIPEDLDYTSVFDDIFEKYTTKHELQRVKTTNMGSLFDLTYSVVLNGEAKEKEFLDEMRVRNGNLKISLSHALEETNLL